MAKFWGDKKENYGRYNPQTITTIKELKFYGMT
jgi:hypothetical protein